MGSTSPLPSPKPRSWLGRWLADPALVYERHPALGDYVYESTIDAWVQGRSAADGKVFLLRGRGRRPTEGQLELWGRIEGRLAELTAVAVAAVPEPPVAEFRARFSRAGLTLAEVRLEPDLRIYLFFRTPFEDEIELAPMVVFYDWTVTAAEWVC